MHGMQPIDQDDPRPPWIQITASIRAAILSGELRPGAQLPTGAELAQFFGVTRPTINSAIRALRDEGYLRTRAGSGVYVESQASLPVPSGEDHPLTGAAAFLFEMGHLKHVPRAGWLLLGIPAPESVAEHSFRVGVVGLVLAALTGADPARTVALCVFHDAHETRIGDVPSVGRAYVSTAEPETVTAHQTAAMPDEVAKVFHALTAEYEAGETAESRAAHDADKLETLLQAAEYQSRGYDTAGWRTTSVDALRTPEGRQLASAILAADPLAWIAPFQASYHELRASTRRARATPKSPRVRSVALEAELTVCGVSSRATRPPTMRVRVMSESQDTTPAVPAATRLAASRRIMAYCLLLAVLGAVAAMSFSSLYAWAREALGWSPGHAALVPVALDIAAMACALLALDSIAKGEAATMLRGLTAAFVALSAFINWRHAIVTGNIAEQIFFPAMSVLAYAMVHAVFAKYRREVRRDLAGHGHREILAELPRLGVAAWARFPSRTFGVASAAIAVRLEAAERALRPSHSASGSRAGQTRLTGSAPAEARPAPSRERAEAPRPTPPRRAPAHRGTDSDIATMKLADAIRAGLEAVGESPREVITWLESHGRKDVKTTRVYDVLRRDRAAQAARAAEDEAPLRLVSR